MKREKKHTYTNRVPFLHSNNNNSHTFTLLSVLKCWDTSSRLDEESHIHCTAKANIRKSSYGEERKNDVRENTKSNEFNAKRP